MTRSPRLRPRLRSTFTALQSIKRPNASATLPSLLPATPSPCCANLAGCPRAARGGHHNMMALTIWQPWASLIMAGAKPNEWRFWSLPPKYIGQQIVIHAGARRVVLSEIEDLIYDLEHENLF